MSDKSTNLSRDVNSLDQSLDYGYPYDDDKESYFYDWQSDYDRYDDEKRKALVSKETKYKKLELEDEQRQPRRSIYELSSFLGIHDFDSAEEPYEPSQARFSNTLGVPGIARVYLSPLTQKITGCVIDETVTTEYPWIYVPKTIIEDNIDLHSESSDFLPIKQEVRRYKGDKILVGYAPKIGDDDQFYVCLTGESHDAITERIDAIRREQHERVRQAVHRPIGPWYSFGSEVEVQQMILTNFRPLLEIQFQTTIEKLHVIKYLSNRSAHQQRDGYVEIVPYRQTFENIHRLCVDKAITVGNSTYDNTTQTFAALKANSSCQCILDRESSGEPAPYTTKNLAKFLEKKMESIESELEMNAAWDIYLDDYQDLADKATEDPISPMTTEAIYIEQLTYLDAITCSSCVINDLDWHPQLSGIVVACYTTVSKCDGPLKDINKNCNKRFEQAFVWSFDNSVTPRIVLLSSRLITAVSFHPRYPHIVIGGATTGQVVIWDISKEMDKIQKPPSSYSPGANYQNLGKNFFSDVKETLKPYRCSPVAVSSSIDSQEGTISKIEWISPYAEIDNQGKLHKIDTLAKEEDLSSQFVASSEDGSIAFWDLKWRPADDSDEAKMAKQKMILAAKYPGARMPSEYAVLNGCFQPRYIVLIKDADDHAVRPITAMSIRGPIARWEQLGVESQNSDFKNQRKYFKHILEPDQAVPLPEEIMVGTSLGEVGVISWEGYNFATGLSLNRQLCTWKWKKHLHDESVSCAVRSPFLKDVVLTIGGHLFALWCDHFPENVFYRKCQYKYTACCWDNRKPTVIILGRSDGIIEIWDFFIKSREPNVTQNLSMRTVTGIYAHIPPLNPQCVAMCDYNGAIRVFQASTVLADVKQEEIKFMRKFIDKEISKMNKILQKQSELMKLKEEALAREMAEWRTQKDDTKDNAEAIVMEEPKVRKPKNLKQFVEQMRQRWVSRELDRMQRVILTKKGLREEELERRREPVIRMQKVARAKEAKLRNIISRADELFEDAIQTNFPQLKRTAKTVTKPLQVMDKQSIMQEQISATGDAQWEIIEHLDDKELDPDLL